MRLNITILLILHYLPGKYNGNIAEIDWKTSIDEVHRRYNYQYDKLNRLTLANYSEPFTSIPPNNFYKEEASYDLNGNITRLWRNTNNSGSELQIDNLTYVYSGNRLTSVTDGANNASGYPGTFITTGNTITYDDNGNMTNMLDKNISSISYNHLNLPNYIVRGSGRGSILINYRYRADGTKIQKAVNGGIIGQTGMEYLDGFQYVNDALTLPGGVSSFLQFVPTSEGYFDYQKNKYIYNYTDHLGNVRLSYTKEDSGIEIIEENNYYPFGLKHEGYNGLAGNPAYHYKYNGKELQTETGMYDYGARFYMPDIGRWGVHDPASEYLPEFSPYTFTFNDPIGFVDNDGEFPGPAGAIIGILADYAGQVGYNYFFGDSNYNLRHAMTNNINGWSLAISGATGFATGGIDSLKNVVTSGVGKPIIQKLINNGIDVLVNTIGNTAADYLNTEDGKEYDFWKSLTGGLLSAGLEKVIPIKYVDKLEQKLFRKMNVSANKVARIKDKLSNLRRNKTIRKWTNKLQEAEKDLNKYNEAWASVKIVNDSYKKFGANSLTNELFLKDDSKTKKVGKLVVGELTSEREPDEK